MRNLKKALALVLALMMALSLMSFASAADYADGNEIEQNEAVDVMSALGVFKGTDGGNFDPDGTLTRAQAAKIITYMLLGQEVADSLPNTGSKFADCPDGRWYVGSVNYLTDLGIVAGRSETTFDPNGSVTGYEFAKMLLGALGYDSKTEQFEGTSAWSINIATTARRAGLGEGLAVSAISSVPLTREQASKLSFNTLTATMVYYQGGVSVGDVTVNPTRYTVANSKSNDYNTVAADQDELMQFCEQYFPNLKYSSNFSAEDDFGRKLSKQWKVGDDAAYTGAADATLVLTDKVSEADLTKMLPKDATVNATPKTNKTAAGSAISTVAALAALTAPGTKVEIYVNSSNVVNEVIITKYTVEKISDITTKGETTTYKFSTSGNKTNVVLNGSVAKGDVVTTATANGKTYVWPTTSFTGSQTAIKTSNGVKTVTIGGAQYVVADGVTGIAADKFVNSTKEAKYYADVNGYLVLAEDTEAPAAPEYGVIVAVAAGASAPTLDNPAGYTVNVRAILADGSIIDRTLVTAVTTEENQYNTTSAAGSVVAGSGDKRILLCDQTKLGSLQSEATKALDGKLFAYTFNSNDKMVLSEVGTASGTMAGSSVNQMALASYKGANNVTVSGATALFTSNTVFVLYHQGSDGKWVTEEPKTGLSGLSLDQNSGVTGIAVVNANAAEAPNTTDTGTASVVFLKASTVAQTTDEYVFIDASEYTTAIVNGTNKRVWTGIAPDGTEVEVYAADDVTLAKDGLYTYDTDKNLNTTAKVDVETGDTTIAADDLYFNTLSGASVTGNLLNVTGSTYVNITDKTQIVYIDSELTEVNGNKCLVVMESKAGAPTDVATIYVFAAGSGTTPPSTLEKTDATLSALKVNGGAEITPSNGSAAFTIDTIAKGADIAITGTPTGGTLEVTTSSDKVEAKANSTNTWTVANGASAGDTVEFTVKVKGDASHNDLTITLTVTLTAVTDN